MAVPVVDLFAGPGGLSEGFDGYRAGGTPVFKCVLSIEKERAAHQTLLLRAFFRQFERAPKKYYEHLQGQLSLEDLYKAFPKEFLTARKQAIRLSLRYGNRKRIDRLIRAALRGHRSHWVLIGGPPCQAYSLAGRVKMRAAHGARFEKDRRHFLYKEYLHIVRTFRPPVFVMENVKGLLSSTTSPKNKKKGQETNSKNGETFRRILSDFASEGYSVHSFVKSDGKDLLPAEYVIEAERHGIPQARHRVILLGIRKGYARGSEVLDMSRKIPIQSAVSDLPRLRSRISPLSKDYYQAWSRELQQLRSLFTKDGKLRKMNGSRRTLSELGVGGDFIRTRYPNPSRSKWLRQNHSWFIDRRLNGITLHESRGHMPTDLRRYLFASHYAYVHGISPKISDFKSWQLPDHENIRAATHAPFADRFRVQVKGRPSTTVVSHISKDGHYYIHYDPTQCRSLTVREAARLQTFPDNYFFKGTRTAQYQQVGNAVPPLLAAKLAAVVADVMARSTVTRSQTRLDKRKVGTVA